MRFSENKLIKRGLTYATAAVCALTMTGCLSISASPEEPTPTPEPSTLAPQETTAPVEEEIEAIEEITPTAEPTPSPTTTPSAVAVPTTKPAKSKAKKPSKSNKKKKTGSQGSTTTETRIVTQSNGALNIKNPVGRCRETSKLIVPPSSNEQICTYQNMLIGHSLPRKGSTYLNRMVARMGVGSKVNYKGKTWSVQYIKSMRKGNLPQDVFSNNPNHLYIVTCDPKSGYTKWNDGIYHAKNNLVVKMALAS